MIKKLLSLAAFAALFSVSAQATVLTFDGAGSLTDQTYASYQGAGDTYTQDGYTLTVGAGDHFDSMNSSGLTWHDGPLNNNVDNYAYLTFDGGLFDLISFDFSSAPGELITNLNPIASIFGNGSSVVNLTGLTWAAFSPQGGSIYLDNVNVTASVAEPGSLALLGLGLVGLGLARKKKTA